MRVALVRGPKANPAELQTYEPLTDRHDVDVIAGRRDEFDTSAVRLPIRRLACLDHRTSRLPAPFSLPLGALLARAGHNKHLVGLRETLADYDVAHAMDLTLGFTHQAAKAKRELDLGLAVTVWQNIPFFRPGKGPFRFASRRAIRRVVREADAFLPVSERAGTALLLRGVPEEKIEVCPTGVDVDRFEPGPGRPRGELGVPEQAFLVLYVGRLHEQKGVYPLVHALKRLSLEDPDPPVHLLVRGGGPEEDGLREEIDRLGLAEQVTFADRVPYEALPDLYNAADAFALPSVPSSDWQEHLGFVLLEAMACGLPIVATHGGAIPEVVGEAGLLVPPADPHGLAGALGRLHADPELRSSRAKAARERAVDRFAADEAARRFEAVYERIRE